MLTTRHVSSFQLRNGILGRAIGISNHGVKTEIELRTAYNYLHGIFGLKMAVAKRKKTKDGDWVCLPIVYSTFADNFGHAV